MSNDLQVLIFVEETNLLVIISTTISQEKYFITQHVSFCYNDTITSSHIITIFTMKKLQACQLQILEKKIINSLKRGKNNISSSLYPQDYNCGCKGNLN